MKYKWILNESKSITKEFLDVVFGSEIIAKLLLNRNIDKVEKAKSYLDPTYYIPSKPEEIPNLLKARDRILEALNKNEKITIFGDYDVDGVTATSCLLLTLKQFTQNIDFYIPSRLTEGYGLNIEAVKKIAKKNVGVCYSTPLLITCDCGITNHKEIELANKLGMDVIVTDHHSLPEVLPPAYAVLNPKLLPQDHKLHNLPGVGVAYKLAESVIARKDEVLTKQSSNVLRDEIASSATPPRNDDIEVSDLLDLVTLGMIADLVPLVDENRYLVQIGLPKLAATNKVGLIELLRICGVQRARSKDNNLSSDVIGFGIAPRINAIGRLADATLAVKLLTTNNLLEAIHIATELDLQNKQRQTICEETLKEAVTLISEHVDLKNDKSIVLAKEDWHHGVLGIVASRVVEKFHLPTILIGIDQEQKIGRGSGRSIDRLNITEVLTECSSHLEKFGGHKAACGLSIKPENINNFVLKFNEKASGLLANSDLEPRLKIDCDLPLDELNLDLLKKINKLAPFGMSNPLPLFITDEVEIVSVRNIGKNGEHIKLLVKSNSKLFEALIWRASNESSFKIGDTVKLAYTPKLNNYNGETCIQLEVKDWLVTEIRDRRSEIRREEFIEVYDFRKRTQECLSLLSGAQITYFAETLQKDFLPLKTFSRAKLTKTENLILLEAPPDETITIDILNKTQPSRLYVAYSQLLILNPQSFLKKLAGMLRYVINNKESKVSKEDLEVALGINKIVLAYALETLLKVGFLSCEFKESIIIKSLNPSRQNFTNLIEYKLLLSELNKVNKFRNWLYNCSLYDLEKFLKQRGLIAKIGTKEKIIIK